METAINIYLVTVIFSVLIAVLIILKDDDITIGDLLQMLIIVVIPVINVIIFSWAYIRADIENEGPVSKFFIWFNNILKIRLKK